MTLRLSLTADGAAIRLPVVQHIAPLVDELALLFASDPEQIGALLRGHAAAVVALDHAVCSDDATDVMRAMRVAEADGTRDALLDELDATATTDPVLGPDDAISLATRLTKHAAHIRHHKNGTARK
ncbi:hypothetical protein ACWENS_05430 [Streptomyces sp. NPDC004532]